MHALHCSLTSLCRSLCIHPAGDLGRAAGQWWALVHCRAQWRLLGAEMRSTGLNARVPRTCCHMGAPG